MSSGVERTHDELVTILYCPDCGRDLAHRVIYRGGTVLEMACSQCGRTLTARRRRARLCDGWTTARRAADRVLAPETGVVGSTARGSRSASSLPGPWPAGLAAAASPQRIRALAMELPKRAVTKPGRLWREVRREGVGVLLTMPRRVATKPVRLMAELAGVAGRRGA